MKEEVVEDSWNRVWMSCDRAVTILRSKGSNIEELTEKNMPANWQELRRLHSELWKRVNGR